MDRQTLGLDIHWGYCKLFTTKTPLVHHTSEEKTEIRSFVSQIVPPEGINCERKSR
jgi:hypothetical protein